MAARDLLRSKELSIETTAPDACKTFNYWLRTVRDYIDYLEEGRAADDSTTVVLKPCPAGYMWPAWPSGVAREAVFIGKKT